jgi:hypothetical protein
MNHFDVIIESDIVEVKIVEVKASFDRLTMASREEPLTPAKALPKMNFPASDSVVKVSIINTTSYLSMPVAAMMEPRVADFDRMEIPCFSFLVEHSSGRKVLFDLGIRKDWQNSTPHMLEFMKKMDAPISVEKDVAQILTENGLPPKDVEAIIWSHWHFDHTGDPQTFPVSTTIVVGPGFKEKIMCKSYPTHENGLIDENLWKGRSMVELAFEGDKAGHVGRFKSYDYFGT